MQQQQQRHLMGWMDGWLDRTSKHYVTGDLFFSSSLPLSFMTRIAFGNGFAIPPLIRLARQGTVVTSKPTLDNSGLP